MHSLIHGFIGGGLNGEGLKSYYELSPDVAALERTHAKLLGDRNDIRDSFLQAQGLPGKGYDPDALYAPPINTARYPYFAFVKEDPKAAMSSGGSQMIVASSAKELRSKIALLPQGLIGLTKDNIKEFKKAEGEYDFNRNFASLKIKSELDRQGILTGLVPETRGANLVKDLMDFHKNQETQLLRDHIEIHNAKLFSQLTAMGERFIQTSNSNVGNISRVSSKDNYPFWNSAQDKLEAFGNSAFNAARDAFGAMRKGILTPEEASKVSEKFGLGTPYGAIIDKLARDQYYGGLVNKLPDKNIMSKIIGGANTILGSTIIRLDSLQQLVHAVTLPIMTQLEYQGATKGLKNLLFSPLPGDGTAVPSFSRTMYAAIKNYFNPDSYKQFSSLYDQIGMPRDQVFQMKRMQHELSFPSGPTTANQWTQKIQKAGDIAETITGTKFVNQFNHFIAARAGYLIGQAKGLTEQELLDHTATFSNRVLGNLAAGQRGAIFHGPIGQAVGLFQSYAFNLYQQLFRNIAEGNTKSVALAAGLQSTMFGFSSLPGFHTLNTLIQTHDGNAGGDDIYSTAVRNLPKGVADWLLYGGLSATTGAALYTRGDISPRRPTILPVNPLEIPSVATAIRATQNIIQMGKNISNGGPIGSNLLLALEHNALSRPLGGLAEMMQGYSTDNKGNLVSVNRNPAMGWSDMFSISNMSRLLGARPLDEAITLDAMYRQNAAKQAEQEKINDLGRAFKSSLYSSSSMAPQELVNFAAKYAAAGGNIKSFNKQVLNWTNQAHTPAANLVFKRLASDPRAKNAMLEMGGVPLPAYQGDLNGADESTTQ